MFREYFELAWISFYLPMATFCDGTKVSNVGHQNGQTAAMGSDVGLYALDLVDVHIDPLGSVAGHRTWDSQHQHASDGQQNQEMQQIVSETFDAFRRIRDAVQVMAGADGDVIDAFRLDSEFEALVDVVNLK